MEASYWKDLFQETNKDHKVFVLSWPRAKHHSRGSQSFLCKRYLLGGECLHKDCNKSHLPTSKLTDDQKTKVGDFVKQATIHAAKA